MHLFCMYVICMHVFIKISTAWLFRVSSSHKCSLASKYTYTQAQIRDVFGGGGGGHWDMPPLGAKCALSLWSAPSMEKLFFGWCTLTSMQH